MTLAAPWYHNWPPRSPPRQSHWQLSVSCLGCAVTGGETLTDSHHLAVYPHRRYAKYFHKTYVGPAKKNAANKKLRWDSNYYHYGCTNTTFLEYLLYSTQQFWALNRVITHHFSFIDADIWPLFLSMQTNIQLISHIHIQYIYNGYWCTSKAHCPSIGTDI